MLMHAKGGAYAYYAQPKPAGPEWVRDSSQSTGLWYVNLPENVKNKGLVHVDENICS